MHARLLEEFVAVVIPSEVIVRSAFDILKCVDLHWLSPSRGFAMLYVRLDRSRIERMRSRKMGYAWEGIKDHMVMHDKWVE